MAAYGAGDQLSAQPGYTDVLPNFVGELFKLSPLDTPFLAMVGGLSGGEAVSQAVFTWQDTLHRAPALQSRAEGADAVFDEQKRNERSNVAMIHQYGVELSYTKQASVGLLGTTGSTPATGATSILGNQPVQDEMSWQLQIKIEQAALDVEEAFLTGTFSYPNTEAARQTQGIEGAVATATTTDYTLTSGQTWDRTAVNDIMQKMYDEGAPMRNIVNFVGSSEKLDLEASYGVDTNWNVQPRSSTVFGVNVQTIETGFGALPVALNRHISANSALIVELDVCAPCFLPIPGKGHFFLEPLSKLGSYDRMQLYGEIGLKYGPAGWHGRAIVLNQP